MSDVAAGKGTVEDVVAALDEGTEQDCRVLMAVMQRISGREPQLWNVGTIGFGSCREV